MVPPLWASWMVSPRTSNSSGGDPVRPLWCHWVKTCQVFGAGKSLANIVLHAYHLSFPSTSLYCADEFSTSLRVPLLAKSPWWSSVLSEIGRASCRERVEKGLG